VAKDEKDALEALRPVKANFCLLAQTARDGTPATFMHAKNQMLISAQLRSLLVAKASLMIQRNSKAKAAAAHAGALAMR
jgi:hypothetical protein